jgi:molybdopterin-synthase adenylyltransferase
MIPPDRHARQRIFPPIGEAGQQRIESARIAVVGCGALGTNAVQILARAGVGRRDEGLLRIVDRDYVDVTNLQRQTLFTDEDARRSRPKALAAADHVRAIDPGVNCQPLVRDFVPGNAREILAGVDLVVDATDNFRARYVINDVAVATDRPWIYGGAIGSRGAVAFFAPGRTPCLRCLMPDVPPLGSGDSCDTAGILGSTPATVAALQTAAALRWIVDGSFEPGMTMFDVWTGGSSFRRFFGGAERDPSCRTCGTREFPAVNDDREEVVTLCGRNSVQIYTSLRPSLDSAEQRFRAHAETHDRHEESVSGIFPEAKLTLFSDGRVIVEGTVDPVEAKAIMTRYLGG